MRFMPAKSPPFSMPYAHANQQNHITVTWWYLGGGEVRLEGNRMAKGEDKGAAQGESGHARGKGEVIVRVKAGVRVRVRVG